MKWLASREGQAHNTTESISKAQAVNTVSHVRNICKIFNTKDFQTVLQMNYEEIVDTIKNAKKPNGSGYALKTSQNKLETMITIIKSYPPAKTFVERVHGDYKTYLSSAKAHKNITKLENDSNKQIEREANPVSAEELSEKFESVFQAEQKLFETRNQSEFNNTRYIVQLMYTYGMFEKRVSADTISFVPRLSLDGIELDYEDNSKHLNNKEGKFYHVGEGRLMLRGKDSHKTGGLYDYDYVLSKYARERILESLHLFPRTLLIDRTAQTIGKLFTQNMMDTMNIKMTNTNLRHVMETVYHLLGTSPARMSLALGHSVSTGVAIYREQLDTRHDDAYRSLLLAFMKTLKNKIT
jgi:hypothetical protein